MQQMSPDIKHTILANTNVTTYFSQGNAATDLREGDIFNSNFLHRSLMNIKVQKLWKLVHPCWNYC